MILKIGGFLNRRGPERSRLRIGYVPTLDAAVLLVAQAKGFFANENLQVQLSRLGSWQKVAEKLATRELDAAQMSGTEPLVAHLGMHGQHWPLRTACVLALGGSGFAVTPALMRQIHAAAADADSADAQVLMKALAQVVQARREAGEPALRFAVTDAYSVGSYDLRYCLASVGIDPCLHVEIVPITPMRMLATLRGGHYDGAWLDEPYGRLAQAEGQMSLLLSKQAFWNHSLGKVLAVHESFIRRHPRSHAALLRAVLSAAEWIESYREEAVELLASRHALDLEPAALMSLVEGLPAQASAGPQDLVIASGAANFPWYSQAVWYLGQMIRWGDYSQVMDFKKTAQAVFQPRYYRDAARDLSLPHPSIGYKNEGEHAGEWQLEEASQPISMGSDLFFDRRIYKPRQTMRYLNGLEISHIAAPLDAMWAIR